MLSIAETKYLKLETSTSLMNHTRYFFKKMYNRRFIVNQHHTLITQALDKVINGDIIKLMINIAPRYAKTELAVKNFVSHGLAVAPASKYIHLSYSDDLALDNSEGIKAIVECDAYRELYPDVVIKKDTRSKKKWYTTAGGGVYATAAGGQVTGFGAGAVDKEIDDILDAMLGAELDELLADIGINTGFGGALIIDDPIKPEDADSAARRERVNTRWESTIKNRVNSRKTPIIVIMQRLHENDLCGHLLKTEPDQWHVLSLPCIYTDESGTERALWEHKHTLEELYAIRAVNGLVFGRQYMQNPVPAGGHLYGDIWKTYRTLDEIPPGAIQKSYIDTADLGSDYLCAITYLETPTQCYITDVYFTQDAMETTEPVTTKLLLRQNVEVVRIESNNGGRGFARKVEELLRLAGQRHTVVSWFHQSENKYARIFTNAATVKNLVVMPHDWRTRWPLFYDHVTNYTAVGTNDHDDGPDALTGVIENFGKFNPINVNKILNAFR